MHQLLALGKGQVLIVDCDMCAYDKKSKTGYYLLKPTRWMVSHEFLAEALSRRCTKDIKFHVNRRCCELGLNRRTASGRAGFMQNPGNQHEKQQKSDQHPKS